MYSRKYRKIFIITIFLLFCETDRKNKTRVCTLLSVPIVSSSPFSPSRHYKDTTAKLCSFTTPTSYIHLIIILRIHCQWKVNLELVLKPNSTRRSWLQLPKLTLLWYVLFWFHIHTDWFDFCMTYVSCHVVYLLYALWTISVNMLIHPYTWKHTGKNKRSSWVF